MSQKVCVLSETEAKRLELHGIKPSCHRHEHVTRAEANEMMTAQDVRRVMLPGKLRIAFIVQWTWRKVYGRSPLARVGPRNQWGPGNPGMQLVRGS